MYTIIIIDSSTGGSSSPARWPPWKHGGSRCSSRAIGSLRASPGLSTGDFS